MRMKALGVALMVGFAAFTTFYWITDAPRREGFEVVDVDEQPDFGLLVFLPDDTYTIDVDITDAGFAQADVAITEVSVFVNTTISFKNLTGGELTVSGTGTRPFEVAIGDTRTSPVKFDADGETTVAAQGVGSTLLVTAGPPHLTPYGANCARCHGVDGTGGIGPNLHSLSLANKWLQTGGRQGLNNYVQWVITLGGIVRSGDINSLMPAWGQEYGGSLTRQQIEALTALIGTWAEETLANPPPEDVPDTVEAGQEIYTSAGCAGCHGADLAGTPGTYPNLQTIGSALVTDLPTPVAHLDQMVADYEADPRAFLDLWIRDSAANYNDGVSTGMPAHPESRLTVSQLQALITFLLSHQ
ncbi:MAG TPA: c-type cytochrome [Candidatus Binatia bacterium]|nr:c-type cytochrome [Candidatus Binatia bacterium]